MKSVRQQLQAAVYLYVQIRAQIVPLTVNSKKATYRSHGIGDGVMMICLLYLPCLLR